MIDYDRMGPQRATVAEHIASLAHILKEFTKSNNAEEMAAGSDYIKWIAEALGVLNEKNRDEIAALEWTDWGGFIIK